MHNDENLEDQNQNNNIPNIDTELLTNNLDNINQSVIDENLWMERTGLNEDTICGAIETIIFMSDRPISITKIKDLIDEEIPLRVLYDSIQKLQMDYETVKHGIRLAEVAEGYQFRTKATYSKYVQELFKVTSLILGPTAIEVIAIIAYKQPVSRVEIDKIRGVDSSHIIRNLMDKRLVKIMGRSNEIGRPVLYGTTPEFLEVFNLATISDLPPEYELEDMNRNQVGDISDIKDIVNSGDKSKFFFDEINELDQLSHSIKSIDSDTSFTKSLKIEDKKRTDTEGNVKKSAFEILEEYVEHRRVAKQNIEASNSSLMVSLIDPTVIKDLTQGTLNAPLPANGNNHNLNSDNSNSFEMIDLNTGLPISDLDSNSNKEIDSKNDHSTISLEDALDNAFSKLLNENNEKIDEVTEKIVKNSAKLDLDFLQKD